MKKIGIVFGVIVLVCMGMSFTFANNTNHPEKPKKYDRSRLMKYTIDPDPENTRSIAKKRYQTCPPLRPERFRRRVKILWGIDLNDYPEEAIIWYDGDYRFSKKYQIIKSESVFDADPWEIEVPSEELFTAARKYMFYDDPDAYTLLKKDHQKYKDHEVGHFRDFMLYMYRSILTTRPQLIRYIDENWIAEHTYTYSLDLLKQNAGVASRISDTNLHLHTFYAKEQLAKGRPLVDPLDGVFQAIPICISEIVYPYNAGSYTPEYPLAIPWQQKNLCERNVAANLSFLLQWQSRDINKLVIEAITHQLSGHDNTYFFIENVRANNYYGYALLREFCENPEREMPTLEKIGTSFAASVKNANTLLYLEPYTDSYHIDTIQPTESFKAYEMGYDDYYFIEISKPVESPVAGADGYAMILDRTETVYGYLRKDQIQEISAIEQATKQITTSGTRKVGVIDDPDGFVNIRKESNSSSETIGKLIDGEAFFYWEIPNSNWWLVQTKDETRGFVHKSRIREKIDAGNWIIEEK